MCYNVQRELPYNVGPNDPFGVEINPNLSFEPSQRIFWGNNQGTNQVGGNPSLWTKLTNKFPFLETMFGRMELPTQYGVPQQQYGVPQQQYSVPQQQYKVPQQQYNVPQQQYNALQNFQQQYYNREYRQRLFPTGRDVGLTDDAVIITPPQVPIIPQPAPQPIPQPAYEPSPGYNYNKPQYRLELPLK